MARRLRLSVSLAALGAMVLAGCAETVTGTGQGSPAPTSSIPTPTPTPTNSTATTGPPPTSSSTTSPAPTSGSSSGSSSSGGSIPAYLRRDVAATSIGDPVTVNYCLALGTKFLEPVGYDVVYAATQYLSGCFWRLRKAGETQLDVTLYAAPSSQLVSKPQTTYRIVNGQRVRVTPLDRTAGSCQRDVFLSSGTPAVLTLLAFEIRIAKTSPKLCQAANLAASALTAKIRNKQLAPLSLGSRTISGLDMCKVIEAGGIADSPLLKGSSPYRRYFGAECRVSGTSVKAYFDSATADPSVTQVAKPTKAGSHTILALNGNTNANCLFSSRQGLLPNGVTAETVEFQFVSQSGKNVPGLCSTGKALVAKFLDTAGLD